MANIKETYFIKNNKDAKEGTALIFYSDGTYSTLNNVSIDGFRKFYNLETSDGTKAKIFDGSRKEVQDAIVESIEGRERVEFTNSNSALYQKSVVSNTDNMGRTAIPEGMDLNNRSNVGRTAIAKGTTFDDSKVDLSKEKDDNRWKYALGGIAAVGAIGGAAYLLNRDKEDEKDKDSMEGKDWKYYLENAKDSDQKNAMTRIYNILERLNVSQNWMRSNDGTSKWGLTPEQALSMYTYFNNLSTEELAQIYNGETVNVDNIMEEANQGMIAMSFFYANDTVGDTTIAELFNDQASKNVISDFTQIQARYNRATNDKERTEIAKEKKQMYYDYFINNSSSKYVDVSSVPGASFVINTMFPVDFVRYFRSSADLGEYDEILVTGRVREDGTYEHRSKVDSACGGLKADLEKYNEDIRELKAEYNAKKSNGFMKVSGKTEYEKLIENTYDTQLILNMMTQNLKTIDKYPANVNTFNSTIDGERRLIAVGGSSYDGSSSYVSGGNNSNNNASAPTTAGTKQEFSADTPEEAAKQAVAAGAPQEMVDKATETIKRENEKAKEEAEEKVEDLQNTYQGYYDDVFNGDKTKGEAVEDADNAYENGEISKDEHDKILGVIADANHDKKDKEEGEELDGTTTGGEITNEGSEVNDDGSIDIDIDGDGKEEHIPSHNPNDPDNPYNMPDYADGAFDVEKENSDDEIVFETEGANTNQNQDQNQNQNESTIKAPNTGDTTDYDEVVVENSGVVETIPIPGAPLHVDENGNYTTEKPGQSQETDKQPIEQNPISDEELGDMTFSGGATSVGTSGGEVSDFTEDQLVDQVKDANDSQEVEIDGSIVSGSTGGEESNFTEDQLVDQFYSDYNADVEGYSDSQEVMSFESFAESFYDQEASQETVAENENVKTLK